MENFDIVDNSESATVKNGMQLGRIGFAAMNNPLRRWIQKHIEFRTFKKFLERCHVDSEGGVIMDAGCGSGYGSKLIVNEYHPSRVMAFDYMPEQIRLAQKRKLKVDFFVGDLRQIDSKSSVFDAVFIFGVLHHIPEWRKALSEVARVLKPGGVLLVDEPKYGFTWEEFECGLRNAGMDVLQTSHLFFKSVGLYLCQRSDSE